MQVAERSLLQAAQAAMERGDTVRAEALFAEHFAQARHDPAALSAQAQLCMRSGRAASACYLLERANALRPGDGEQLNLLGYAWLEREDHGAARQSFEAALAHSPGHVQVHYGLAMCLRHAGAWAEAAASLDKALAAPFDTLPVLLKLADTLHRAGELGAARQHYERAMQLAPDSPAAQLAYGAFLRECGQADPALALVERCLRQYPDEPRLVLEKSRCLRLKGDTQGARRWLEQADKRCSGLAEHSVECGECLAALGDGAGCEKHWLGAADGWIAAGEFIRAGSLLDRLLAARPDSAAGWNARGALAHARQQMDRAEAAWRQAIACDPAALEARANLALLYESTNRLAMAETVGAEAVLQGAVEAKRGGPELLLALSKLARRRNDRAHARTWLDRLEACASTDAQRQFMHFERGRQLDLLGDAAGAMAAFAAGNALARSGWLRANPGRNRIRAGIEHMLERIDQGWLQQWKPLGPLPDAPAMAFLVGFPRSGTTLLNQILDSHDAIQAMEEKPPVSRMMDVVRGMPGGYPDAVAGFDAWDIGHLRGTYFRSAALHGAGDPSRLVLDKFPMHLTLAALLHRVFPQARFVFALRHPCDVVLSCFMQSFELNNTMANFCMLEDTVALYTRSMDLWEACRSRLPLHVHTVRYEDVVDDFDRETRSLCAFLGVPWEEGMRRFPERALSRGFIDTPSYEQVSRPIYREARFRWQRYREQLAPHLPALRPYIERYGYGVGPSAEESPA